MTDEINAALEGSDMHDDVPAEMTKREKLVADLRDKTIMVRFNEAEIGTVLDYLEANGHMSS